jgi:3-hydroxyisobutyryl-CoA hydrolase
MSSKAEALVLERRTGGLIEYTLNRPNKLNALSAELCQLLIDKLQAAENDKGAQVIAIRGRGRAFCAGGDVVSISLLAKDGSHGAIQQANTFMRLQYTLDHTSATFDKKITVAFWHSITMGGGIGFSVPFDFRVCTSQTMIAMPECGISFFPDVGASYFLNQLEPGVGMYLALSGARVTGYDAVVFGLATHFMAADEIDDAIEALGRASTHEQVEEVLRRYERSIPDAKEARSSLQCIKEVFTAPTLNEIIARLEAMNNAWSLSTLKGIRSGSPTAVSVTFEMLKRGRGQTAEACRHMEYTIHTHFMRLPDFVEGVDKKLVCKPARSPQWKPAARSDVTQSMIEDFFKPIAGDGCLQLGLRTTNPKKQNRFVRTQAF